MLTKSEKQWLEDRADRTDDKFCRWCPYNHSRGREEEDGLYCYCYVDWESEYRECLTDLSCINRIYEAAEFERRVAAKLAEVAAMQKKHHCCVDIDIPFHCPGWQSCAERMMSRKELRPCAFEMLKGARIEVEEEMDGK